MSTSKVEKQLYASMWRWHFYVGLLVMPFLTVLSVTGLIMVLSSATESYRLADKLYVAPDGEVMLPGAQVAAVEVAYPDADIQAYIPPVDADRSAEIVVVDAIAGLPAWEQPTLSVFVNPYSGEILGVQNPQQTLYALAQKIHGTLLLGTTGDYLVEIGASFAVLLVISGLFLWWPRSGRGGWLYPGGSKRSRREAARSLHASVGFWMAPVLLFFLISGLAWTPVWGGQLTQAWSSFPAERMQAPTSERNHEDLNHVGHTVAPWVLEQTPLPESQPDLKDKNELPVSLNQVVDKALAKGFTTYRVLFPQGETGAWTISAVTMSGDVSDPRSDRTLHIDQYSGEALADVGFAEYSIMGKVMAAGIALHQAETGWLNLAVNLLLCMSVIILMTAASIMWWRRRPEKGFRLLPPPQPMGTSRFNTIMIGMGVIALAFPLALLVLVGMLALDWLLISRIERPGVALK